MKTRGGALVWETLLFVVCVWWFVGACPPCPKTMILKCHCGRGPVKPQRCGLPGWSCGEVCGYTLSCGFHTCERLCHEGIYSNSVNIAEVYVV